MVDVTRVSNEANDYLATTTDGYADTPDHSYQIHVDQNTTADEYWSNNNSTNIYQSYQNVSIDDKMTIEQYSTIRFALLIFEWILSPLILLTNGLSIIVIVKYIKKVTPSHMGIAFLAIADLFVGIVPVINLPLYTMGSFRTHV